MPKLGTGGGVGLRAAKQRGSLPPSRLRRATSLVRGRLWRALPDK
nr:MAG TPA: hypothetical protein [Caudoviricetes sp.]